MENYIKTLKFTRIFDDSKDKNHEFELILLNMKGIQKVTRVENSLYIEFNSFILSKNAVTEIIRENGYESETSVQNKKGFLTKWIEKLAKTNKENFGNDRLECCDLND